MQSNKRVLIEKNIEKQRIFTKTSGSLVIDDVSILCITSDSELLVKFCHGVLKIIANVRTIYSAYKTYTKVQLGKTDVHKLGNVPKISVIEAAGRVIWPASLKPLVVFWSPLSWIK